MSTAADGGWARGQVAVGAITVAYLRTGGEGPPAVLLHGLAGSGACWTPVAEALAGELDVIMPDARGHGGSSAPASGYDYDALADDVIGVIDGLGLDRPALVGHSMGGLTAAVVAARRPASVRGLVLVDPTFLSPARQREVYASDVAAAHRAALAQPRAALIAAAQARHPRRAAALIEAQVDARCATAPAAFAVLAPPLPDHHALVRALAVPALLVIGDAPVVTPDLAAALAATSPRLTVAQVADAGHGLPFDQPARLAALVAGFVRPLR